jgi:cytochrome c-type biogenesis protein CcmH
MSRRQAQLAVLAAALLIGLSLSAPAVSPAQEGAPTDAAAAGVDPNQVVGPPAGQPLSGAELYELTEKVAGEMRCPVCQGLSVADSQTPTALAMKAEVRQMLAAGYTEVQVVEYFEKSYGEFIRLAPKAEGFNLLVWIAPVAAIVIGVFLVVGRMRRQPAAAAEATAEGGEAPEIDPELLPYLERVRREVAS